MMEKNNGGRWLLAGAMLGAVGAMAGQKMMKNARKPSRRLKTKAATMAGHLSRDAGEMLGVVGEALVGRMR